MKNVILVLTFFSLWLSTQMTSNVQDYVAFGLILTIGILHGANDISIISTLIGDKQLNFKYLLRYIGAVALVSLLFFISKGLTLLFFILISAYHFGEQHFSGLLQLQNYRAKLLQFFYGLIILFTIFYIKLNEVTSIIHEISSWALNGDLVLFVLVLSAVATIGLAYNLSQSGILKMEILKELFYLLVLSVLFANASLVWGFAIYFIVWHSLPSMYGQLQFLCGKVNKENFMRYIKSSLPYWLVSVLGLALLYWLLHDSINYFISVVLYVLAAITFPHVLVMSKVEHIKK